MNRGENLEPTALIDEHGAVIKGSKGNHRFAIARLLGLQSFPLKIVGVHRGFLNKAGVQEGDITSLVRLISHSQASVLASREN